MSKWVDTDKYNEFAGKKEQEKEQQDNKSDGTEFAPKFRPARGSFEKAKEYEIRFVPDPNGRFYEEYFYHGFYVGEKFKFIGCEKNKGMDKYCPWCAITQLLYQGSNADKKKAGDYKRKNRYVGNVFVIDDPRDAEIENPDYKNGGTMRLYEFPATVESKIKKEVTDKKNGYGLSIFDPENGYSLLLSIGAKKPDNNKKVWPDYGQTMFARRPSAIASGEELEEIMSNRYDLQEFIDSLSLTPEEHRELLTTEMVYEDVEREFELHMTGNNTTSVPQQEQAMGDDVPLHNELQKEVAPTPESQGEVVNKPVVENRVVEEKVAETTVDDDEALLASLRNL